MTELELVTIGRASVDLYGQQTGGTLEDMSSFVKAVGGCPANIAIGASRLGLATALVTRVGGEHMGRFIIQQLEREGVNTAGVKVDPDRLTALVLLWVCDQHTFPLIFYRENCADAALCSADIDAALIASAGALLVTGTHFSREHSAAAQHKAIRIARAHGRRIILDIDYRPNLWGMGGHASGEDRYVRNAAVTQCFAAVLPECDLIVGTEEEIHIAAGVENTMEAIRAIRRQSSATIVCKRGMLGCVVFSGDIPERIDQGIVGAGFKIETYNVLGAGDAFMSGFLRGYLRGEPLEVCATYGNACGAITVSRLLCSPTIPTWPELRHFLKHGSTHLALRKDDRLNHLHWVTTRRPMPQTVMAFAIDHRAQLEQMASDAGAPLERISAFKLLAVEATAQVASGKPGYGMLLDGTYGSEALPRAAGHGLWVARPVELPGSRPLDFDGMPSVGAHLIEWPINQTVKCLCFYHPDDPEELRLRQERELLRIFAASRTIGRELMIEIICSKSGGIDDDTTARVLARLYSLGIMPDWWKLEPQLTQRAWENCSRVIDECDSHCRGIMLLGLDAPLNELVSALRLAACVNRVKGFAVGRTIFGEVARQWLVGDLPDAAAVDQMAARFRMLVEVWSAARLGSDDKHDVIR